MSIFNLADVPGTTFPAGRTTRVLAGPGAPAEPDQFVMGHVTIYPDGEVPGHSHPQEEVYFIVSGQGVVELDDQQSPVGTGSCIAIRPQQWHCLKNVGRENLIMVFCYAPKGVVAHWQQELQATEGNR